MIVWCKFQSKISTFYGCGNSIYSCIFSFWYWQTTSHKRCTLRIMCGLLSIESDRFARLLATRDDFLQITRWFSWFQWLGSIVTQLAAEHTIGNILSSIRTKNIKCWRWTTRKTFIRNILDWTHANYSNQGINNPIPFNWAEFLKMKINCNKILYFLLFSQKHFHIQWCHLQDLAVQRTSWHVHSYQH